MKKASASDFTVDIDGVGQFRFGRRGMRDQFKIDAMIAELTAGYSPLPDYLAIYAEKFAAISVLAVAYPDGWDPETLDPLEEASYRQLTAVHAALREKEDTFRHKPKAGKAGGEVAGGEPGVLVPQKIQPAAD
jgi:hypothetical protein